jgi:hypothetical protein
VWLTSVRDWPDAVWWEVLRHRACTLDLLLQDFHFFGPLKEAQKPYMCWSLWYCTLDSRPGNPLQMWYADRCISRTPDHMPMVKDYMYYQLTVLGNVCKIITVTCLTVVHVLAGAVSR